MKKKFPAWFSPHSKPGFYTAKPTNSKNKITEIERINIDDGYVIDPSQFVAGVKYKITYEHDYSGCYYAGETPSIKCEIVMFLEEEIPNEKYNKELEKYNNAAAKHKLLVKEWSNLKTLWDEEQKAKQELKEIAMLKRLKEKYEKAKQ